MASRDEIANILELFEGLPNNPIANNPDRVAELVNSYYVALGDLPLEMLNAAALAYLSTGRFFPAPGDIRARVVDIALLAMGVPTAGEAWGMVNGGMGVIQSVRCPAGERLRRAVDGLGGGLYWKALNEYSAHVDACPNCYDDRAGHWHKAVQQAFDAMGGDDAIFTDNPAADRARFMDGYREFVQREVLRFSLPAEVRGYIEQSRVEMEVDRLAGRMSVPALVDPRTGERLE